MKVAGIEFYPRNLVTPGDDRTILNITFWSSITEKHASGVGYATVILAFAAAAGVQFVGFDAMLGALGVSGLGGVVAAIRAVRQGQAGTHLRDALRELGYTALGAGVGVVHVGLTIFGAVALGVVG